IQQVPVDVEKFLFEWPRPRTGRRQRPSALQQPERTASAEEVREEHINRPWSRNECPGSLVRLKTETRDGIGPAPDLPLPRCEASSIDREARDYPPPLCPFQFAHPI